MAKSGGKSSTASAPPAKGGAKSGANTSRTTYMDATWKKAVCDNDRKAVDKHCKEKPPSVKEDEKYRKGGLVRMIREVTSGLDELGQGYYEYKKGKPPGNEWMDDYCNGMWVKPRLFDGIDRHEMGFQKKKLDALGDTVESLMKHPGKVFEAGYEQLARQAVDRMGYDNVVKMLMKKFGGDAIIAALPVKAGAVAKLATIGKVGLSSAGFVNGAQHLATALGTDHAKEILQSLQMMLDEKKDRLVKLQEVWKNRPDIVTAELMSLNAEFDACLRARKCHFTPYRNTGKDNANKGNGCCPGQTPHHVIPNSAVIDAKCKGYTHDGGPTICLEGQDNHYASHGRAHDALDAIMDNFNGVKKAPQPISYAAMRDKSLEAIKDQTSHCSKECLKAQLDDHYVDCESLVAKSGKGGAVAKEAKPNMPTR